MTWLSFFIRALAEEELMTNITETEVFVLPSGQEIEKEGINKPITTIYSSVITTCKMLDWIDFKKW